MTEKLLCTLCNIPNLVVGMAEDGSATRYTLSCGHTFIALNLVDTISVNDTLDLKRKGLEKSSKKHVWNLEQFVGNRIGRDGKLAFVEQVVDRVRNYYKKYVKVGDVVVKNIESKLTDHK